MILLEGLMGAIIYMISISQIIRCKLTEAVLGFASWVLSSDVGPNTVCTSVLRHNRHCIPVISTLAMLIRKGKIHQLTLFII